MNGFEWCARSKEKGAVLEDCKSIDCFGCDSGKFPMGVIFLEGDPDHH